MRVYLVFLFLSTAAFGQKAGVYLHGGLAKRSVPISLADKDYSVNRKPLYDDKQYTIPSLTLDVRKSVWRKKLDIQASTYFRYGHDHYQRDVDPVQQREVKKFRADIFLDLIYNKAIKKSKKDVRLLLGIGAGQVNLYSAYDYNEVFAGNNGGTLLRRRVGSFEFFAPRLILGAQLNKFRFFVNALGTPDDNYESYPSLQLEAKLTYQFISF